MTATQAKFQFEFAALMVKAGRPTEAREALDKVYDYLKDAAAKEATDAP